MKKLIALLLALVLMLSFAACGGEKKTGSDEEQKPTQSQNKTDEEKPEESKPEASEPEATIPTDDENNQDETPFTEIVVVDNEQCLIKITGIENDIMWGYSLKVYLENKSADQTYMFSVDDAAINGVQTQTLFATEVAPGKKANESLIFMEDMSEYGIGDFTDIELAFCVSDSEDWQADPVTEASVHVYPYGEDKATQFTREAQTSDLTLVDNEYVTAIVTGYEEDEIWGHTVQLYLVNKTDKTLMFSAGESSVNGFMIDALLADTVSAGRCAFGSLVLDGTAMEESGITEMEEIEFMLQVYDLDDMSAEYVVNESVTLNP